MIAVEAKWNADTMMGGKRPA
eukprot:SAG11_NODE_11668_length_745_cov_1.676471_1_plen_20_part_01